MTIFGDTQGALALAQSSVFHPRSKHMYHFTCGLVEYDRITIKYIPTVVGVLIRDLNMSSSLRRWEKLKGQQTSLRLTVTDDRFRRQSGSSCSCTKSGFPSQIKTYHDTIDEGSVEVGVSRSESARSLGGDL
jgi:hypothetical protein